jgi:hypothetical protein
MRLGNIRSILLYFQLDTGGFDKCIMMKDPDAIDREYGQTLSRSGTRFFIKTTFPNEKTI